MDESSRQTVRNDREKKRFIRSWYPKKPFSLLTEAVVQQKLVSEQSLFLVHHGTALLVPIEVVHLEPFALWDVDEGQVRNDGPLG